MNNCLTCGELTKNKKYCSRTCSGLAKIKDKITRQCQFCGINFEVYPSAIVRGGGKYCSSECSSLGSIKSTVNKKCKFCGVMFSVLPSTGRKYCSYECFRLSSTGIGGMDKDGYWRIYVDGNRVREHRHIMEEHLGRKLEPNEVIHHKDRDRVNNDISNLELMTKSEHAKLHRKESQC